MPANAGSLQVTANYQAILARLAARVAQGLAVAWTQVNMDDLEGSFDRWLALAAPFLATAKGTAATFADVYVASFAGSETGQRFAPLGLRPEEYRVGLDGRETREVMGTPLIEVRKRLQDDQHAREALTSGVALAQRTAMFEVVQTGRVAQRDAMARPEVVGWRRALSAGACGACLGSATGAIHPVGDMPKVHRHDRCVAEPVIRGLRDRFDRPTGEQLWHGMTPVEQDNTFTNRGGRLKADLVRGGLPLTALVSQSPMVAMADEITETPFAALA